jgi:hypothetical protein
MRSYRSTTRPSSLRTDQHVRTNRRFTLDWILETFPHIYRTFQSCTIWRSVDGLAFGYEFYQTDAFPITSPKKPVAMTFRVDICLNVMGFGGDWEWRLSRDWRLLSGMMRETHVSFPVTTSITRSLVSICATHLAHMFFVVEMIRNNFYNQRRRNFLLKDYWGPLTSKWCDSVNCASAMRKRCLSSRRPWYLNRGYKPHRGITCRRLMTLDK